MLKIILLFFYLDFKYIRLCQTYNHYYNSRFHLQILGLYMFVRLDLESHTPLMDDKLLHHRNKL